MEVRLVKNQQQVWNNLHFWAHAFGAQIVNGLAAEPEMVQPAARPHEVAGSVAESREPEAMAPPVAPPAPGAARHPRSFRERRLAP